jgi:tetratricopeptide (TPR) repeat protein
MEKSMTKDEQAARAQAGGSETAVLERLRKKGREELLFLVEQLLERKPDIGPLIELLIELPVPHSSQQGKTSGRGNNRTLNLSSIGDQVEAALSYADGGWESAGLIAAELSRLCEIGDDFAEAGEWANAQVVYAAITGEAIARYEELEDEWQIAAIIDECTTGLALCLDTQRDLPEDEQLSIASRGELLTALFEIWKFEQDYGGIETDVVGTIVRSVTKDERAMVEAWLRQEIRSDQSSKRRNHSVVSFLVKLKEEAHISNEELIEEYRNAGLYKEMAEKLLQLGRVDEALHVAEEMLTDSVEVTWFAEQLVADEARREQALELVERKLKEIEQTTPGKSPDYNAIHGVETYRSWLEKKYSAYGMAEQALNMALARFRTAPSEAVYNSIQSASQLADRPETLWSTLRPDLLATLEQQGKWGELVNIYLNEGEIMQALAALELMERASTAPPYSYGYSKYFAPERYQLQVAKAAEEPYPDEAIQLYKRMVERLINTRGRENYQQASGYLKQVKHLYERQGHESEWNTYITALRNKNKSLRALQEELDKRGL